MRDKAKATAGSLAAEIRRATLRLERTVILRGELALCPVNMARSQYQGDILGRACALEDAKNRATRWEKKAGLRAHVITQAMRAANAAITRAFRYYGGLI
jgi:hypothetical protein